MKRGGSADVSIVGAEDDARMTEYFTFRTRVGHDPIPFEEDSVILTEKNGPESGAERGRYVLCGGSRREPRAAGADRHYRELHVHPAVSLQCTAGGPAGQHPEWNTVYGLTGCTTEAEYNTPAHKAAGLQLCQQRQLTEDTTSMFGSLIGSLNYVVVLIIVCAAALAAVVLYNLISVNLAERKKRACHHQGAGLL